MNDDTRQRLTNIALDNDIDPHELVDLYQDMQAMASVIGAHNFLTITVEATFT